MRTPSTIHALLLASASFAAATAHAQTAPSAAEIASAGGVAAQPANGGTAASQSQSGTASAPVAIAQNTSPTDEIVVTGRRFSDVSRLEQKNAINLVNIQPAEEIVKYPDFNAAESLGRIPGVSLSTDTGEGRFVNIRGLDANLNGTTFGGVQLLNTQPGGTYAGGGGRAVELDTIPIGAIDQLIVRKTGLPNQEAEGLGGSVDLIPRTAQGIKKSFLEIDLGSGYQNAHNHWGVYRAVVAGGLRFGPDRAFGIEVNGSYHEDHRGFDDTEPAFLDADPITPTNKVLDVVDLRRYNYNRRRFGFGAELTYDPSGQSHYYIRADQAGYTERVNRQILNYSNLGFGAVADAQGNFPVLAPDASGTFVAPAAVAQLSTRDEEETHLNFVSAFGGHNDLGRLVLDYQGSFTSATYHRYNDYNSTFDPTGIGQGFPLTYNNNTITGLPAISSTGGFNPSDPTQFVQSGFRNTTETAHDEEWAGRIDVTVPVTLVGQEEQIRFGGKLRLRDKNDAPINTTYSTVPATPLTQVQGGGPYTNFYGGQYNIGYAPSFEAVRKLLVVNPGAFATSANQAQRDRRRDASGFFKDTENIYAGYFEYQGKINKFGYLVGFRVENTDGTYRGIVDQRIPGQPDVFSPSSRKSSYTDFFPTVQARYDFSDRLIARATYSTAIGRPGFNQLQAGATVDTGALTVRIGNPDLKPTTSNAFDLSIEYYLPRSGILSFGLFDKEFDNYIVTDVQNGVIGYDGIPGLFRISAYRNIKNSYARGFEAQYDQKLTFLPAPFDGFGVLGNVTYVDSTIRLHQDGPEGRLPGTSTLTWNLAGYYEKNGAQVRLAAQYVSPSIFGVGGSSTTDTIQDTKFQVDLTSSYAVTKYASVYFNARNLFNGPLRYYEGFSNRPLQREFYDQSYEFGARFRF